MTTERVYTLSLTIKQLLALRTALVHAQHETEQLPRIISRYDEYVALSALIDSRFAEDNRDGN